MKITSFPRHYSTVRQGGATANRQMTGNVLAGAYILRKTIAEQLLEANEMFLLCDALGITPQQLRQWQDDSKAS